MKDKSAIASENNFYRLYLTGFFVILALPLLIVPPWFYPADWGKAITFRIIFSVLLFGFACHLLWKKDRQLQSRITQLKGLRVFWALAALVGIYFLAAIFGADTFFSLWGSPVRSGGFINYALCVLFGLMLFLVVKEKDWPKIWDACLAVGTLVCVIGLTSWLGLLKNIFVHQTDSLSSTMGNASTLGLYLLMLVYIAAACALKEKNWIKKTAYALAFFLFCTVLLLTISQGAYLGLGTGFLYFAFFWPVKNFSAPVRKKIFLIKAGVAALMVLGVALVLIISSQLQNSLNDSYIFSNLTKWHIDQSRLSAWRVASQAILHRPVLGYGPENFSVGFDKYYDPSYPEIQQDPSTSGSWWDRPHNFVLNVLSDAGILGLVAFVVFFGLLFWQLQKLKSSDNGQVRYITVHGLQTALVAYFADLFFNFDDFSTCLTLFLIVGYSLSLIAAQSTLPENTGKNNKLSIFFTRNKKIVTGVLFVFLIYFIWFLNILPFGANAKVNIAQFYIQRGQCSQALETMGKQLPQRTLIDTYFRLKYIEFLRDCNTDNPSDTVPFSQKGVELLKENTLLMPSYTRNWLFLGAFTNILIAQEQNPDAKKTLASEAEEYFKKATQLSPKREEIAVEWAKENLEAGDYQGALEKSTACVSLNLELPDCWWLRGLAKIYLGNTGDGQKDLATAQEKGFILEKRVIPLDQLADAYATVKDYRELALVYEKLIQFRGDLFQYHASLAFTYRELKEYAKARQEAQKVLELKGGNDPDIKQEVELFLQTLPQ